MFGFRRSLAAILVGLILSALLPAATASATCYTSTKKEKLMRELINKARNAAGQGNLRLDPELSKVAKKHTYEMVRKNRLYHTPNDTLKRRVTNWKILGENVGYGGGVYELHKAFMNSAGHRANVLYSSFRHVGIGTVEKGDRLWVTVIFEARSDPGSPLCN